MTIRKKQLIVASSYFDNICRDDTYDNDGVKRDSKLFEAILRTYSRNISTLVSNSKMMADIEENYGKISDPTFYSYISVLKKLFVIDNVPAWTPNIRSKQKIRKSEKNSTPQKGIKIANTNNLINLRQYVFLEILPLKESHLNFSFGFNSIISSMYEIIFSIPELRFILICDIQQ